MEHLLTGPFYSDESSVIRIVLSWAWNLLIALKVCQSSFDPELRSVSASVSPVWGPGFYRQILRFMVETNTAIKCRDNQLVAISLCGWVGVMKHSH